MFSQELQDLVKATLVDGVLTGKERDALVRRAKQEGADLDELEIYINSLLQKKDQEEAKASLAGNVKRCPNCGGIVEPGWAACPHCGVSFNNEISANNVVAELHKKLNDLTESMPTGEDLTLTIKEEYAKRKFIVITSTPVPNNRKDLLELLAHVKSMANKYGPNNGYYNSFPDGTEDLGLAYWHLYSTCIDLARVSYVSDPAFIPYFKDYEQKNNQKPSIKQKWRNVSFGVKYLLILAGLVIFVIILGQSL